jgi:hypothetical protein
MEQQDILFKAHDTKIFVRTVYKIKMTVSIPAYVGYIVAVVLLIIGVATASSIHNSDTARQTSDKRLSATVFILVSVLTFALTWFGTKDGGFLLKIFGGTKVEDCSDSGYPSAIPV